MTIDELKEKIIDEGSGYTFRYGEKLCGMEPIVEKGVFTFGAWSGDKNKDYADIDDLMTDKFYSGKSIEELLNNNDIELDFI
ncbi:hypothetical protein ACFQAV_08830 [Companilactobacillus huachuanensis]|uniref:Uncharacterized protein n=1 Tax=Companilactobacillus huachuanensis TaxID=2559914 RepID=A0ABW1RPD5_9LACO|nr:hypothetical protein [Companilactobacillus huachuanensis]